MKIYRMDNHDIALKIWRYARVQKSILIHIDAHLDFVPMKNCNYVNIGNFLSYALYENIFVKIFWIIPDRYFSSEETMQTVICQIQAPFEFKANNSSMLHFSLEDYPDRELIVTGIKNVSFVDQLLQTKEEICVDIDLDFFMNSDIRQNYSYGYPILCWIGCNKLYEALECVLQYCSIITIAKSIYGGYTPLLYSYLADYLFYLFSGEKDLAHNYVQLDEGACFLGEGRVTEALACFALDGCFSKAHISRKLGLLYSYIAINDMTNAKKVYRCLSKEHSKYEAYFFPISALLIQQEDRMAGKLIEAWRSVSPYSEQANLFSLKYLLRSSLVDKQNIDVYSNRTSSVGTKSEKNYVLADLFLKESRYEEAIQNYTSVLRFLKENDTPVWAGQISSFEKKKNHGIIISEIYEKLVIAYLGVDDMKNADVCAHVCKRMGRTSEIIDRTISGSTKM